MYYQDLLPKGAGRAMAAQQEGEGKTAPTEVFGEYPVTAAFLWVVHLLYFMQWRKSRRRRRNRQRTSSITYRTLVEKKHFYKWWPALLSQYHPSRNVDAAETESNSLTVDMGHVEDDDDNAGGGANNTNRRRTRTGDMQHLQRWLVRQWQTLRARIPESCRESAIALRMIQVARLGLHGFRRGVTVAGGKSLVLLLYNTHLLWSCRALERYSSSTSSGSISSHFDYFRLLVGVGLWETLLELFVSLYFLRALGPNSSPTPPAPPDATTSATATLLSVEQDEPSGDSPILRHVRRQIRNRTMGVSLSMISAALLMIFRFRFPYVGIPVLPWIPISRWLSLSPFLSYVVVLFLLHHASIAATCSRATSWVAIGCGSFVGMLWGSGWLDFCSNAYWGNGMLLMTLLLTVLSLKPRNPYSIFLRWIDRVGWNERGNILLFDTILDRWVEQEEPFSVVGATEESESESEDSISDDDDSDRAFPAMDDNEIYGRLPSFSFMEMGQMGDDNDGHDDEDETTRLIEPPSPTIRSRRTVSLHSDSEDRDR